MIANARRWLLSALFLPMLAVSSGDFLARADDGGTSSQVTISEVRVGLSDHGPVVLLSADGKTIPVFVDHTVAASIQAALTGEKLPRPLSHELMHTILESLGGRVVRTVITLKSGTLREFNRSLSRGRKRYSIAVRRIPSLWPSTFMRRSSSAGFAGAGGTPSHEPTPQAL